ncbi:MAG: hypothetical protein ABW185_17985 [Sedimenticola sp.]
MVQHRYDGIRTVDPFAIFLDGLGLVHQVVELARNAIVTDTKYVNL